MSGRNPESLVPLTDFIVERTREVQARVVGGLRLVGRANPFVLVGDKGVERIIPLAIAPFADDGLRGRFSDMFRSAADLVDMTPEGLATAVAAAKSERRTALHPSRWVRTVARRLRVTKPDYVVIAATARALAKVHVGITEPDRGETPSDTVVVAGMNAARTFVLLTPFSWTSREIRVGEPETLDSVRGNRWDGGLMAKIYEPERS